ncbi:MAG: hypothetical protein R3E79_14025 [Caldilineaceae bacterium]
MNIALVLAPELELSRADLIMAWNAHPQAGHLATASAPTAAPPPVAFPLDPQLQQALIFLGVVAGGIAIDLIKETLQEVISDFLHRKRQQRPPPAPA